MNISSNGTIERVPGQYWIQYKENNPWEVAFWCGDSWHIQGLVRCVTEGQVFEIDENRIVRKEITFSDQIMKLSDPIYDYTVANCAMILTNEKYYQLPSGTYYRIIRNKESPHY